MNSGLYDIHSHILPCVDDGSASMEMTMEMIAVSYEQGVRCMFATPHYHTGKNLRPKREVDAVFREVKERAESGFEGFRLLVGNEIFFKEETVQKLKSGDINTMAGTKYVLVEFPVSCPYQMILNAVNSLGLAGYYPIIAHVERYQCLYKKNELITQLIKAGAYIQVNAENFLTGFFFSGRNRCLNLIDHGLVHFIGSDCHNLRDRRPNMEIAEECIRKRYGKKTQDLLMIENPEKMIRNEIL